MHAPKEIPSKSVYTMNGLMRLEDQYIDQATPESQQAINEQYSQFDNFLERTARGEMNYYHMTDIWLYQALREFYNKGESALIIGSTQPWYEAVMRTHGCENIVVSEYGPRPFEFEHIKYVHPDDLEGQFDCAISISSYEHCGLGRYGDPLDPDGDLHAMRELKNHVKPGGILFLAVPIGQDTLVWNAHRIYGVHRLPRLFEG